MEVVAQAAREDPGMAPRTFTPATVATVADLIEQLGGISPRRIRAHPPPGTATERDVTRIERREKRLYELVDGVLVEKVMGFAESVLAMNLVGYLMEYLRRKDRGILAGESGTLRLMPGLVRIPDISFVSWERLPGHQLPTRPIPDLAPDLAVEVLSKGNTAGEMARKLKEYFLAGVRLVWFVDPRRRTVTVYTAPDQSVELTEAETLDGRDVLPGLAIALQQLFAGVPHAPKRVGKGKIGKGKRQGKRRSGEVAP
jgi:Uma2 family endonuclease